MCDSNTSGPMLSDLKASLFKIVHLLNKKIKTTCIIADKFIITVDNNIMKALNIAHTKDTNEVVFIGKIFQSKRHFMYNLTKLRYFLILILLIIIYLINILDWYVGFQQLAIYIVC